MPKLTTTATTDLTTLPAETRKMLTTAYDALAALEPTPARIRKAAASVGALRGIGVSVRGIVALLSVEGSGNLPTSKGSIERLGYVADALTGKWPTMPDNATRDAIVVALYRVAQAGRAADVARAAERGRASADADAAYTAVTAVRDELNAERHRALTSAPERPTAGETADGGKVATLRDALDAEDTAADSAEEGDTRASSAALSSASFTALMAELHKRVTNGRFTPDAVIDEAWTALGVAYEEAAARTLATA